MKEVIFLGHIEKLYKNDEENQAAARSKQIVDDHNQNSRIISSVIKEILDCQENKDNRYPGYEWVYAKGAFNKGKPPMIAWEIENSDQNYHKSSWKILLLSDGYIAYLKDKGTVLHYISTELEPIETCEEKMPISIGEDKMSLEHLRIELVNAAVNKFKIKDKDHWLHYRVSEQPDSDQQIIDLLSEILTELKGRNK